MSSEMRKDNKEKSEIIRLFKWLFSKRKAILTLNKWLVFPLSAVYIALNSLTILNYDPNLHIHYKVWNFFDSHGISNYFFWLEDIGMNLAMNCNDIIAIILVLMMIADVVFSIRNGRKTLVKWIFYVIITVIILFIGFVASPEFYDSV